VKRLALEIRLAAMAALCGWLIDLMPKRSVSNIDDALTSLHALTLALASMEVER
jgi:hypothetical protein